MVKFQINGMGHPVICPHYYHQILFETGWRNRTSKPFICLFFVNLNPCFFLNHHQMQLTVPFSVQCVSQPCGTALYAVFLIAYKLEIPNCKEKNY